MKNNKKLVAIVLVLTFILCGCGAKLQADISTYENEVITVTGLTENEVVLTVGDLSEMKCEKKVVKTQSKKGEISVSACGPRLDELLKPYELNISNIESMKVIARDGYTGNYDADFFVLHDEIILSIANGKEALDDDEIPVRMVIPDTPADQWIRSIEKIEITLK